MATPDKSSGGVSSATSFKIVSFNANSIGRNPKRQNVLFFLKKKNPDFLIVCDTRICKTIEDSVREDWNGSCIFNSFSSQSRGVAIFMKKGCTAEIIDDFSDDDGNVLAILVNFQDKRLLIEGIYGPNSDSPAFYSDTVFKKIVEWRPEYSIFSGDFNIALNETLDTRNYLHSNNPSARKELLSQMETYNLIDIWRESHP